MLVSEEEFRELVYDLAPHSAVARRIADRWWSEELKRVGEIEEGRKREAERAQARAGLEPVETPSPVPAALP